MRYIYRERTRSGTSAGLCEGGRERLREKERKGAQTETVFVCERGIKGLR